MDWWSVRVTDTHNIVFKKEIALFTFLGLNKSFTASWKKKKKILLWHLAFRTRTAIKSKPSKESHNSRTTFYCVWHFYSALYKEKPHCNLYILKVMYCSAAVLPLVSSCWITATPSGVIRYFQGPKHTITLGDTLKPLVLTARHV